MFLTSCKLIGGVVSNADLAFLHGLKMQQNFEHIGYHENIDKH